MTRPTIASLRFSLRCFALVTFLSGVVLSANSAAQPPNENSASQYFGIQIVDQQSGRGVPLVRLRTTGAIDYWSDSNGWVAFLEPGLMNKQVFFSIDSPGYEFPADGFGIRGARLETTPGKTAKIEVKRINRAERLYRVTGQGIYRDSQLLNQPYPKEIEQLSAGIVGQDSVQMVPYKNGLFWLWGDTNLQNYPLGNFHTTVAITPSDSMSSIDPESCVLFQYFKDDQGYPRKMLPTNEPGVVWMFGLINLPDDQGQETLVGHYSRHLKLGQMVEHGIATWDETKSQFVQRATFGLDNRWRIPRGQAVRLKNEEGDFVYFTESFANTRVPASLTAILDPAQYQSFAYDEASGEYRWQSMVEPTGQKQESQLLKSGKLSDAKAKYQMIDIESRQPVDIHRSSVQWNDFRKRWIMIACQFGDRSTASNFGEIWYAESTSITGPWVEAVKIASHPHYTFYNPRHHACLDSAGGKVIYFEGTYTHQFSGNESQTPRYDYNQIMYRLDLTSPFAPRK